MPTCDSASPSPTSSGTDHGTVTGVIGRTRRRRAFHARARIVVGADGIRSTIAERGRRAVRARRKSVAAVTYGYWTGLETDGYEWNFRPDAAPGVIPTNDGRACVFASATRAGSAAAGWTTAHAGSSPSRPPTSPPGSPPPRLRRDAHLHRPARLRPPVVGPGLGLVGDAGYFKDPLTSHGLTDALRDAELLARAIVAVVVDGADERDALAGYQRTRDALSGALFDVTDVIAGHRSSS